MPLTSLATVAWAQLLVFVDFRIDGLDLVPDPLGWLISAVALSNLARAHGGFMVAGVACFVAMVASIPDMLGGGGDVVEALVTATSTVLVFATCTAIMAVAPAFRGSANALRWTDLVLLCATLPLRIAAPDSDGLELFVVLAVVAVLATFVWFLVLLFQASKGTPAPAGVS